MSNCRLSTAAYLTVCTGVGYTKSVEFDVALAKGH
jgi:hypothetical protein